LFTVAAGIGEHTPGAKAPFLSLIERPKAKALGYLDAKTTQMQKIAGCQNYPDAKSSWMPKIPQMQKLSMQGCL
jgi:hypothetical protein